MIIKLSSSVIVITKRALVSFFECYLIEFYTVKGKKNGPCIKSIIQYIFYL